MAKKFIISRPYEDSGLGANLLSFAGALYLAEKTNRDLIVDWTGLKNLNYREKNLFTEFFVPLRDYNGVNIIYSNENGDGILDYDKSEVHEASLSDCFELLDGKEFPDNFYLYDFHYRILDKNKKLTREFIFYYVRSFYFRLQPQPSIAQKIDELYKKHFEDKYVICCAVRTGNGAFVKDGPYSMYINYINQKIISSPKFPLRLKRAAKRCTLNLQSYIASSTSYFIVTENEEMQKNLCNSLDNAFSIREKYAPPTAEHGVHLPASQWGFDDYDEYDNLEDVIINMFLMAKSDAFIYNCSGYNQYALHISNHFNGKAVNFEKVKRFNALRSRLKLIFSPKRLFCILKSKLRKN